MPAISVCMITYNHEKYIGESIQSVLDQTFDDFELIVVNDGSTDRTEEIIKSFDDPRLVYICQENQGPSTAGNTAMSAAKGDYIASMSGDDVCYPQRLEREYAFLKESGSKVVFAWVDFIDENSQPVEGSHFAETWYNHPDQPRGEILGRFFFEGNYVCSVTAMFERPMAAEAGMYLPTSIQMQDFVLWLNMLKRYDLRMLPEKLIKYRIRAGEINLSHPANGVRSTFEAYQIQRQMLDGVPVELFREAFGDKLRKPDFSDGLEYELEKAFIYLQHSFPLFQSLGAEKLFELLRDKETLEVSRREYNFGLIELYKLTSTIDFTNSKVYRELQGWTAQLEQDKQALLERIEQMHQDSDAKHKLLETNYQHIAEKDRAIAELYQRLEDQNLEFKAVLETKESDIAEMRQEIEKQGNLLRDKYNEVAAMDRVIRARYVELAQKDRQIGGHLETQARLRQEIADQEQARQELAATLARYEQDLRSLQSTRTVRLSSALGSLARQPGRTLAGAVGALAGSLSRPIEGNLDLPAPGEVTDGVLAVTGWAIANLAPVRLIEVLLEDRQIGQLEYGLPRPDVAASQSRPDAADCGFAGTVKFDPAQLGPGPKTLTVYITDTANNRQALTRQVTVEG